MNIPYTFTIPVLACGMCIDTQLTGTMPFLFYWLFCLLAWSLVVGPVCLAIAKRHSDVKATSPLWLFPGLIAAYIITSPILMGSVVAPIIIILPFWSIAIIRALKQSNMVWKHTNQIVLAMLLCCIPLSYILPLKPFSGYRASLQEHRGGSLLFSETHSIKVDVNTQEQHNPTKRH